MQTNVARSASPHSTQCLCDWMAHRPCRAAIAQLPVAESISRCRQAASPIRSRRRAGSLSSGASARREAGPSLDAGRCVGRLGIAEHSCALTGHGDLSVRVRFRSPLDITRANIGDPHRTTTDDSRRRP